MFNTIEIKDIKVFLLPHNDIEKVFIKFNVGGFTLNTKIPYNAYIETINEQVDTGDSDTYQHLIKSIACLAYQQHVSQLIENIEIEDCWISKSNQKAGFRYKIDGRANDIYLSQYTNDSELYDEFTYRFEEFREDEVYYVLENKIKALYAIYWSDNYSNFEFLTERNFTILPRDEWSDL